MFRSLLDSIDALLHDVVVDWNGLILDWILDDLTMEGLNRVLHLPLFLHLIALDLTGDVDLTEVHGSFEMRLIEIGSFVCWNSIVIESRDSWHAKIRTSVWEFWTRIANSPFLVADCIEYFAGDVDFRFARYA